MKTNSGFSITAACVLLLLASFDYRSAAQIYTITFDDLAWGAGFDITGGWYDGVYWEQGNAGFQGYAGGWVVGYNGSGAICYSDPNDIVNKWGSTLTGMTFPSVVDVEGAYFAVANSRGGPSTTEVRVHGYLNGLEIETTGWFDQIGDTPVWFNMNLSGVNRIVIESVATDNGAGWYGMDNFTYIAVPEPSVITLSILGLIGFAVFGFRQEQITRWDSI